MAAGEHLPSESPLDSSGLPLGKCSPSIISIGRPEHHPHQVDFRLAGARKRSEHHRHRVDSRLTPKEASIIIGVSRAAACKTAQASSASSRLSLARCPPPGKRASSASAALLLPKLPEHHLHQAHIRLAGGPPPQRSQHQRHQLGVFFYKCRIIGISWAASCLPIGSSRAASCTSAEHHLHQVDSRLAGASPPPPLPAPAGLPPKKRGMPDHLHQVDFRLAGACKRSEHHWHQLGHFFHRCHKKSEHRLHRVDSRLAVAPPEEASIIGVSRAAACKTAQASSLSSRLSLARCPLQASEQHRHQQGCFL